MTTASDRPTSIAGPPHDPYAALRLRDYRLFALGNILGVIGGQMITVAIAWELYQLTNSATALGLVGLVQVVPLLLLSIPAGHLVDQFSRRHLILLSQLVLGLTGLLLGFASFHHQDIPNWLPIRLCNEGCTRLATFMGEKGHHFDDPLVPLMFLLITVNGAVRALNQPAKSAYLPQLVPPSVFGNAVTWNSSLFEICSMVGPAIGGGVIALFLLSPKTAGLAYASVYVLNAICQLGQFASVYAIRTALPPPKREPATLASLSAGVRYVWHKQILLATLSLDLFAVILGGAVALLPIYARDILNVGPIGLGCLRAAPSVGACIMGITIAHRPPMARAGRKMLWAVAGFGVTMIVFGLSTSFWLSMLMLALSGVFDNVSVVVRQTLVQVLTPDAMRGRVSAVNAIFIGSSNQIGALESGLTAATFGSVASVVGGGIGTVLVVIVAAMLWPELRRYGRLGEREEC